MSSSLFSSPRLFPPVTKILLWTLGICSVGFSIATQLFPYMGWPSPWLLFGVHPLTLREGWIWTLASHTFITPIGSSFGLQFLIFLALDLLFVGQLCHSVERRLGARALLYVWLGVSLLSGIVALLFFSFGGSGSEAVLIGDRCVADALLVVWTMMFAEAQVLFFLTPIRVQWLSLGLLGMDFLQLIAGANWLGLVASLAACIFAWGSSVVIWNLSSPARWLWPLESRIRKISASFRPLWQRRPFRSSKNSQAVIIDFRTGEEIHR